MHFASYIINASKTGDRKSGRHMATKMETEIVSDGAAWIVKRVNSETGKVSEAETLHANKPVSDQAIGGILAQEFKHQGTRRDAWQSMLAQVFANPRLDGYRGKGDVSSGKIVKELKNAVSDAEKAYVRNLVENKHVKLKVEQGDNEENAFQKFVSAIVADKNYSNLKTTVVRFFHFCGGLPVTESGYLIPVPVMQARLAEVMVKTGPDNTIAGKLRAIVETMAKGIIDSEDAIDSLAIAKELVLTLRGNVQYYAELATEQRHTSGDVARQGEAAIKAIMAEPVEV